MSDDSSSGSDNEQEKKTVGTTIADDLVVTKYKMASEITNRVLKEVMEKCQPNTSAVEVCTFGDQRIAEETEKVFKKEKNMKKGIRNNYTNLGPRIITSFIQYSRYFNDFFKYSFINLQSSA